MVSLIVANNISHFLVISFNKLAYKTNSMAEDFLPCFIIGNLISSLYLFKLHIYDIAMSIAIYFHI